MTITEFVGKIVDFFFPPKCISCGKLLMGSETGICPGCLGKLPENRKQVTVSAGVCCSAPYLYAGDMKSLLLRLKFSDKPFYADVLGSMLADTLSGKKADFVTWIPVSRRRKFERGYDQAQLLAERAAEKAGFPCVSTLKKKHTKRQSSTGSREERQKNVQNAFTVPKPETVAGRRVILIDDICTTGATLSEASKVLLRAGAASVECVTLALTEENKDIGETL